MSAWVKVIPPTNLDATKQYFLSRPPRTAMAARLFYARDIHGKTIMSEKPGIAIRFQADEIAGILQKHADHEAIEVPADADTRWRRRRKRHLVLK